MPLESANFRRSDFQKIHFSQILTILSFQTKKTKKQKKKKLLENRSIGSKVMIKDDSPGNLNSASNELKFMTSPQKIVDHGTSCSDP